GDRARVDVNGHVTIVIDDGIATGATTRAALRATRMRNPQKLVLAIPVAPTETLIEMRQEADDVVCLEAHQRLGAIGWVYEDFTEVADRQVVAPLAGFALTTAVNNPAAGCPPPRGRPRHDQGYRVASFRRRRTRRRRQVRGFGRGGFRREPCRGDV